MAWQLKVTEVSGTGTRLEGDPLTPTAFDLTADGRWRVHVVYFDSASPSVVLHECDFILGADALTTAQALELARVTGRRVRDARALVTQMQAQVGSVFQVN
jgi:hypothetical protein